MATPATQLPTQCHPPRKYEEGICISQYYVIDAQSVIHKMGTDERKVDPIKNADLSLNSGFFPSKISDVSSKDAQRGTVGFSCLTCDCWYSRENDYKIHMRNKHRKELKTRYE